MPSPKAVSLRTLTEFVDSYVGTIQDGSTKEKYEILPQISVIRSSKFVKPLLEVLKRGSRKDKEFAALALGTLERTESLPVLYRALVDKANLRGVGTQSLQTAILVAIGEIGKDSAVPYLRKAMGFTFKGDKFFKERQRLILSAAGSIAQQGGRNALGLLREYLFSEKHSIRAHALAELSVAYWHRPNEIPQAILDLLFRFTRDASREVKSTAIASIASLADLGCARAELYLQRTGTEV